MCTPGTDQSRGSAHPVAESDGLFAELNPNPLFRCDADGWILRANPVARSLLGSPCCDPRRIEELLPDLTRARLRACISDGRGFTTQAVAAGRDFLFSVVGIPDIDAVNIYGTDVTSLKAKRFRTLVEHAGDSILLHDKHGVIVDANPEACRQLGYERDELRKMRVADIETEMKPLGDGVWNRLEAGAPVTVCGRQRRKDGTTFPVEVRLALATGDDSDLVIALCRDLTDRERAIDLERRLHHADKLASIGQMAAGVAHEINNPAAFLEGNLSFLEARLLQAEGKDEETVLGTSREEALDLVRECLSGVKRITTTVRQLTAFARVEEARVKPLDVSALAQAAINLVQHEIRHRAKLILDLQPTPTITGDPDKLLQMFVNLLVNASQSFGLDPKPDAQIRVTTGVQDGRLFAAVEDTGCGIPEEIRERIFEPFFTTKPRGVGTGLGLALCTETARKHGGILLVESQLGRGSRFELRLPLESHWSAAARPREEPTGAADERPRVVAAPAQARILIIDDEPLILRAFQRLLKGRHAVTCAHGAEEALSLIEQQDAPFDLILCDLMMPGMDGVSLFHRLCEVAPDVAERVVFVTGGVFEPRVREFLHSHSVPMLEKPINWDAVQRLLLRSSPESGATARRDQAGAGAGSGTSRHGPPADA